MCIYIYTNNVINMYVHIYIYKQCNQYVCAYIYIYVDNVINMYNIIYIFFLNIVDLYRYIDDVLERELRTFQWFFSKIMII
jgi:hypothetical protein